LTRFGRANLRRSPVFALRAPVRVRVRAGLNSGFVDLPPLLLFLFGGPQRAPAPLGCAVPLWAAPLGEARHDCIVRQVGSGRLAVNANLVLMRVCAQPRRRRGLGVASLGPHCDFEWVSLWAVTIAFVKRHAQRESLQVSPCARGLNPVPYWMQHARGQTGGIRAFHPPDGHVKVVSPPRVRPGVDTTK
jgi:hypothetical protein